MRKLTILMLLVFVSGLESCQQKAKNNKPVLTTTNVKVKVEPNIKVLENLDQILSPFEDMTEFALDKNEAGILKSMSKVDKTTKELIFKKNISLENYKILETKIKELKKYIKEKKYEQVALASTEIFDFNVSHFVDANKIQNQIKIEHLDYMGFKILALLNQKNINWLTVQQTITSVQKKWDALSEKVTDRNLKDSFNFLFQGLHISAANKNVKLSKVLANMDLSMVDVLENSF